MPYAYAEDTIFYYETSGTFTNGVDIYPLSGYIEVPAGSTSVGIDIIPVPDTFLEDDETIIFSFPFIISGER